MIFQIRILQSPPPIARVSFIEDILTTAFIYLESFVYIFYNKEGLSTITFDYFDGIAWVKLLIDEEEGKASKLSYLFLLSSDSKEEYMKQCKKES